MNYGSKTPSHMPPPPPAALIPRAKDINNQPAVTLNGNILLPMGQTDKNKKLYKLVNWKKAHISDIGDVPIGSAFVITHDKYKAAIKNHEIPDFYKPSVFIVNDGAQPADYYFIYNVISKIVKYNFSGRELWQTKIPRTPEVDSLTRTFYNQSEKLHGRSRIRLKKYVAGVSSKDGHFYLALGKYGNSPKDLWIHAFSTKGKLIRRYKLVSKDVDLAAIFAIDSSGHRIFVATRKGKIRAYSF